jgi:hypothetical protein
MGQMQKKGAQGVRPDVMNPRVFDNPHPTLSQACPSQRQLRVQQTQGEGRTAGAG